MPTADVITSWEHRIDEISDLYRQVHETFADLPETRTDLARTTSKGAPPPLPGGDKLAALAPFNMYAPRDTFPHPLLFAYSWAWHCAEASRSIPPRRAWGPCIAYVRAHLHLIGSEHQAEFHADMSRVLGMLRSLCHIGRKSQQEEGDESNRRGAQAQAVLRGLVDAGEFPEWKPLADGAKHREPVTVDRTEAEIIFPELRRPNDDEFSAADPADIEAAWHRIAATKKRWEYKGDRFKPGRYLVSWVRDEAEKLKTW